MFINIYGNDVYVIQLQGNDAVDILDETEKDEEDPCPCCNTIGKVISKEQSDCGFSFVSMPYAESLRHENIDAIKEFLTKFIDICNKNTCRECPLNKMMKESGTRLESGLFGCIKFTAENTESVYKKFMN